MSGDERQARGFRRLLGDDKWSRLLDRGGTRICPPGSTVLRQGERGTTVMAVVSGRVKVLGTEPEGRTLLLALRGAGDLLGEMAARSVSSRTATVETIDRCVFGVIPVDRFNAFLDDSRAQQVFADYVIAKLSQTVDYKLELVHFPIGRKIARLLLELRSLADDTVADPARVPFSQQAVADALGLSRSTVALHIGALRDTGALRTEPRLEVADLAALRAAAGV